VKKIFLSAFLLAITLVCAQTPEQKKALAAASHDSIRCRLIEEYIGQTYNLDEELKLNKVFEKIVNQNLNSENISEEERAFYLEKKMDVLGNYAYHYQNAKYPDIELALDYHKKSLALAKEIGNEEGIARCYVNMGFAYEDIGDLKQAIDYYDKALVKYRKLKDKGSVAVVLNNLAYVFQSQENYDKALQYFRESLKLNLEEKGENHEVTAFAYSNIGLAYSKKGNLEDADNYDKKAYVILKKLNHQYGVGLLLNNIGDNYHLRYQLLKDKSSPQAITFLKNANDYLLKSIAVWDATQDWESKAITLKNLGEVALKQKQIDSAILYGEQSLEIAKKTGFPKPIRTGSHLLYLAYKEKGDTKKALEMYELYSRMNDSIINEQNRKKILEKGFAYEYDKKAALLKEQAKEDKERSRIILTSIVAILVLMCAFFVIWAYYYKKKKKAEKLLLEKELSLEVAEAERRRISADLHDDLGPGIAGIALSSDLLAMKTDMEQMRADARKISENSQKVSTRLSEVIWELNVEHDNLEDLLLFIQKQGKKYFKDSPVIFSMRLPLEIPNIPVPGNVRRQVYFAVKECFHNILKHSGGHKATCEAVFDNDLILTITDNGQGFDTNVKHPGEGLTNLNYRCEKLNGNATISSSVDGTVVSIRVPLANPKQTL